MKFNIEKGNFSRALGSAQSVVERRNTIPILNNVVLEAKGSTLSITGTDMDIVIVDTTEIQCESEGSISTPAGPLFDIVKQSPEGAQISVELNGDKLIVTAGRSKFDLPTLSTDEFPTITGGEMPHSFKVGANELNEMINNTSFAISNEETRYYLNGIFLQEADGQLVAVATDGHRLAKSETAAPEGAKGMPEVIIPKKAINELNKMLEQTDSEVEIKLSDSKIKFQVNSAVITTKLVDGTFPDYKRVIPSGNPEVFKINCDVFSEAVRRVSILSDSKMCPIKVNIKNGTLKFFASHPQLGTATDEMEVDYSGAELEIGFNARYLTDIASQIKNGEAIFELKDGSSPSVIKNAENESVLYVLMPMRV
ncbi:MAG: DNA polymerase III subunit beta [Alphaproteobacteria bacterium]